MRLKVFLSKVLITIILILIVLIGFKKSTSFKDMVHKNVYDTNISFAYLNTLYNKYLGTIIPFKLFKPVTPVFSETLRYKNMSKYLDGVELEVDNNYLVPTINDGIVIFSGFKDGYGNTTIIQGSDNVEVWYSNISSNIKLYDYIEKGSYIGDTLSNKLYLVFKKDGNILNYEDYIK